MPEKHEKLKTIVRDLEGQLRSLEPDEEAKGMLREVLEEIRGVLQDAESTTESQQQSWQDRLNDAAYEFEGADPNIAGVIRRLMDGLGQMGI